MIADLKVQNHGTIFLLVPITPAGEAWCDEHLPEDRTYWGKATVVEHRYISDIVEGAIADGLEVR